MSKVRIRICCLISFELSAFTNYVTYICRNVPHSTVLSLSLCVCVWCMLCLHVHIVVHFICQNLKNALDTYVTPVCVCVCVCVSEWVNMLVPCCICALLPVLHLWVEIFRFMPDLLILYANFYRNKCSLLQSHTCVFVCVCAWDRMFVPICICALDPGLYKNVKHSRFILGLLLFLTNET